ncbi:MAG: hypothetical protein NVS9B12_13490 [Vulcanimicrobiaceae bacterium]
MMIFSLAFLAALAPAVIAQAAPEPPAPMPPGGSAAFVDTRGPCLDSAKQVPNVMDQPNERSAEIVRIDKVMSLATYTPNQLIGFLYTRQDGKTYLGMRTLQYTSPASAQQLNQVLASTHAPGVYQTEFPPQTKLGVPTRYSQFFEVRIPGNALEALQVRLEPCVVWPAGRSLPDPPSR